jgi:hypothetical protein
MRAVILPLLLLAAPAGAQPADCPTAPGSAGTLPVWVDLQGRPGVPAGTRGYVQTEVTGGGTCAPRDPDLPRDILRGPPGNVLHGPSEK